MVNQTIKVQGMHCASCKILLEDVLSEISGVKNVQVDVSKGTVSAEYDKKLLPQIKKAIVESGYVVK